MRADVEFNGEAFARALIDGRKRLGLSTRELAGHAGISQSYVVALERSRFGSNQHGPTPTIDVAARLARALGIDPIELFNASLRHVGRHILFVADNARSDALEHVRRIADPTADMWILAAVNRDDTVADVRRISVHPTPTVSYDIKQVSRNLADELKRLNESGSELPAGQRLGLIFTEIDVALTTAINPDAVIAAEDQWPNDVAEAAAAIGSSVEWNICVYQIDSIRRLPNPLSSALSLLRSHDTVWAGRKTGIAIGRDGARHLLTSLRPATSTKARWAITAEELLREVGLAS